MNLPHRALIVEDNLEIAGDMAILLEECGCESVVVSNRRDALQTLERELFCIVILDLEIKAEPDSIRGLRKHGASFLREARMLYPDSYGSKHALPIVVHSAFASDTEDALAVMKDGASDVVQKLYSGKQKIERIHEALESAGRTSHRVCEERLSALENKRSTKAALTLSISGQRHGRRVVVHLGERRALLTPAALKVLLHLVKGRLAQSPVHKTDLGHRGDKGFRIVSVLREQMGKAYDGNEKELVTNDQHGHYELAEAVSIGNVDTEKLERIGEARITSLAREIRSLSSKIAKSAGIA